jgi:hypothetical protein
MIDGEIIQSKSRQSSNTSQQRTTITDQNKKDSRRSSTDTDLRLNDKRQSPSQKRSGQQSRKGSNKTTDSKKSGKVI